MMEEALAPPHKQPGYQPGSTPHLALQTTVIPIITSCQASLTWWAEPQQPQWGNSPVAGQCPPSTPHFALPSPPPSSSSSCQDCSNFCAAAPQQARSSLGITSAHQDSAPTATSHQPATELVSLAAPSPFQQKRPAVTVTTTATVNVTATVTATGCHVLAGCMMALSGRQLMHRTTTQPCR